MVHLRIVFVFLVGIAASVCAAAERPPNFVLIVADDLGYGDVGCYGSTINATPNIDALAGSGLRFPNFHSAGPMCSPTRAAMLTGQYQQRFGRLFDTAISGVRDRDRGLPLEAVTIADVLKQQSYATACFGKWHLGYRPPWLPTSQRFDVFRGLGSGDDTTFGGNGNHGLSGYTGNDLIFGDAGNDLLIGHDGMDTIEGAAGMDTLVGGGGTSVNGDGTDSLDGGADADQIDGEPGEYVPDPADTIAAFTTFPSWVDAI